MLEVERITSDIDNDYNVASSSLTNSINNLKYVIENLEIEKEYLLGIIRDILESEEDDLEDALTQARDVFSEMSFNG